MSVASGKPENKLIILLSSVKPSKSVKTHTSLPISLNNFVIIGNCPFPSTGIICEPATSKFKLSLLQRYRHKIISLEPSISITFLAKKPSLYIRLIRKRNSFNFALFNSGVSGEICLGNASLLKNTKLHNSDAVFNSSISAEWVEIIIVLLYLFAALFISRRRYDCNCGCKDTSGSSINNTSTTSSNRAAKIEITLTNPLASAATEYSCSLSVFPKNTFICPASQRIKIFLLNNTDNLSDTLIKTSFRSSIAKKSPLAVSICKRARFVA